MWCIAIRTDIFRKRKLKRHYSLIGCTVHEIFACLKDLEKYHLSPRVLVQTISAAKEIVPNSPSFFCTFLTQGHNTAPVVQVLYNT